MSSSEAGQPSDDGAQSITLMSRVCASCVRLIPVTGAAVSMTTRTGYRETVSATDDTAAGLEELHFVLGEGPGVDALRDRQPVLAGELAEDDRWPLFTPAALSSGARGVFAYPLQVGAGQLGVLLMYVDTPGRLTPSQRSQAVRIAHAGAFAVLDLMSGLTEPALARDGDRLVVDSEFHRSRVYQASGMIMVQLGVTIEEALVRLRAHAFGHGRALGEVAEQIVDRKLRLEVDTG